MKKYAGLISSFTRAEIDQLFAIATPRARTRFYTLLVTPRSKDFARILIVTPKKLGNAVVRNKLRRRVKALFYQEKIHLNSSNDFVFIARHPVMNLSFEHLKEQLCPHLTNTP